MFWEAEIREINKRDASLVVLDNCSGALGQDPYNRFSGLMLFPLIIKLATGFLCSAELFVVPFDYSIQFIQNTQALLVV